MGGSFGVLLAIFFAATGNAASSGLRMREALQAGLKRMQEVGGANLGDRTMVDALAPALEALGNGINEAAKAARTGADHTATILQAKAGALLTSVRSSSRATSTPALKLSPGCLSTWPREAKKKWV